MFPIIGANTVSAAFPENEEGIVMGGNVSGYVSMSNLISDAGVVSTDVTGVASVRSLFAGCEYGDDKGIFGFGINTGGKFSATNLVSNVGVVATDTTGNDNGIITAATYSSTVPS